MMETTNLSKIRRDKMLNTISEIKKNFIDEEILLNLSMIENELTKKKYGLIWGEHEECIDKELETKIPTFEEIKDKEIVTNLNDKYNFLLEGDNLHRLYLLEKTHKGKIDVNYIDPPYNTGNKDFVYGDNYVESEDGFRHSKWLSFIERRLKIAKNLLKNEEIILINIDIKVENKFEALKEYAKKYNVNWGFVRDYDKNDRLYLCNTEYTDEMENNNWVLLENKL